MNISRLALVSALGLGLSSTGCLGNADPLVEDMEPPHFKTLADPGGGVSTNGLSPSVFHANKGLLETATGLPLKALNTPYVSDAIGNTGLLNTEEGKITFDYAVRCAYQKPLVLTRSANNPDNTQYEGFGLLSTTGVGPRRLPSICLQEGIYLRA